MMGCDRDKNHPGPFYSVNLIAYQVGEGCFPKGAKRRLLRFHVGRLCLKCLGSRKVVGLSALIGRKAVDPLDDC